MINTQKTKHLQKNSQINVLIVDGQNILMYPNGQKNPRNLEIVRSWAKEIGVQLFFIFPGYNSIRKIIKTKEDVIFLNSTIYDDEGILEYARDCDAAILSNDRFREFRSEYSDYDFNKVFRYAIASNNLITEASEYFESMFDFIFTEFGDKLILEVVQ